MEETPGTLMRLAPDVRFKVMRNLPPMDVYRKYVADTQEFRDWAERINDRGENLWIHLMKKNGWISTSDMNANTNTRHLYIANLVVRLLQNDWEWNATADYDAIPFTMPRLQTFRFSDEATIDIFLKKWDSGSSRNTWYFRVDIPTDTQLHANMKSLILSGVCSYLLAQQQCTIIVAPAFQMPLEVSFGNMLNVGGIDDGTLSIIVKIIYGFLTAGASYLTTVSDNVQYNEHGAKPGPMMRVFNQIGCSSCGNSTAQRQCGNLCGAVYCGDECAQSHYNKHAADCVRLQ